LIIVFDYRQEGTMKTTMSAITQVVGAVTLIGLGYIVLNALPDLKRYIKMSRM
jgi:hypothetical protein